MLMLLLLMFAVVFYFVAPDRRYLLAILVVLLIESLTLGLMWLFDLPSMVGYITGSLILIAALVILLLREDRKVQTQVKVAPIYIEHTPVYEEKSKTCLHKT